jgi:DNA-binding transcriptional LysR family regulator
MELRHLRYFIVTAEELHFTRAAQRIGIAQPPLTKQIKALEAELGVQLFERQPGQVKLTSAGEVFLDEARGILDHVTKAIVRSRSTAKGMIGRLSVGMTESASFHPVVTSVLQRFCARFPEVQLSLDEALDTTRAGFAAGAYRRGVRAAANRNGRRDPLPTDLVGADGGCCAERSCACAPQICCARRPLSRTVCTVSTDQPLRPVGCHRVGVRSGGL